MEELHQNDKNAISLLIEQYEQSSSAKKKLFYPQRLQDALLNAKNNIDEGALEVVRSFLHGVHCNQKLAVPEFRKFSKVTLVNYCRELDKAGLLDDQWGKENLIAVSNACEKEKSTLKDGTEYVTYTRRTYYAAKVLCSLVKAGLFQESTAEGYRDLLSEYKHNLYELNELITYLYNGKLLRTDKGEENLKIALSDRNLEIELNYILEVLNRAHFYLTQEQFDKFAARERDDIKVDYGFKLFQAIGDDTFSIRYMPSEFTKKILKQTNGHHYFDILLEHEDPKEIAGGLLALHWYHLLNDENINIIKNYKFPSQKARELHILDKAGLLKDKAQNRELVANCSGTLWYFFLMMEENKFLNQENMDALIKYKQILFASDENSLPWGRISSCNFTETKFKGIINICDQENKSAKEKHTEVKNYIIEKILNGDIVHHNNKSSNNSIASSQNSATFFKQEKTDDSSKSDSESDLEVYQSTI